MTTESDDPFDAFAAQLDRARQIEEAAQMPLLNGPAATSPTISISQSTTIDDAAEMFLQAEAMQKSAGIIKKAAMAFIAAIATNRGQDDLSSNTFKVVVEREDATGFDGDAFQAQLQLQGGEAPDFMKAKFSLTAAEIKKLTPAQRAALGPALVDKGEKVSIKIERI